MGELYQTKLLPILKSYDNVVGRYNMQIGERNILLDGLKAAKENYDHYRQVYEVCTKSRTVLDALSRLTETQIKDFVEPLVTEAINLVFDYDIQFGVTFGFEKNQVIVDFTLTDKLGNTASGDIEDMKGGGIMDVISIVMRFILLELFGLEGPILLDEPGKFVDKAHQPRLGQLILSFAQKFNRQILIVTHDDAICAIGARHYVVQMNNQNVSEVKLVEEK